MNAFILSFIVTFMTYFSIKIFMEQIDILFCMNHEDILNRQRKAIIKSKLRYMVKASKNFDKSKVDQIKQIQNIMTPNETLDEYFNRIKPWQDMINR